MKILFFLMFAFSSTVVAQTIDYSKVIPSSNTPNLEIADRLVLIAWRNYPENEVLRREVAVAEEQVTLTKWSWLDIVSINGNLNEYTINPPEQNDALGNRFYPRYNFGARINLSMFGTKPAEVRQAKEQVEIARSRINQQKLALRAMVLKAYQNYLMSREMLTLQEESTENALSIYSVAEQKFTNGDITLEEYNESLNNYNESRKQLLTSENQLQNAIIDLEELIGVSLQSVL